MAKLETFDKKTTSHIGLWWDHQRNNFKSQVINLAALKAFKGTVRIVMIKNKFFEKGSNKPNYIAYITDSESAKPSYLDVVDYDTDDGEEVAVWTRDQVRSIINGAVSDARAGFDAYDILPEDFADPYFVKESLLDEE